MPWKSLRLLPGLDLEQTPSLLESRYTSASLVRWREGLLEKLGGWTSYYANSLGPTVRQLLAWQSLNNTKYLAIGSTSGLSTLAGGKLTGITPQTFSTNSAVNFTTTMGSYTVKIVDSNVANVTTWDSVNIVTPISVDGIILCGNYPIQSILSTNSYTITAGSFGLSGVTSGGAVATLKTNSNSSQVTVGLANHGLSAGNSINIPVSTTIGGITIYGNYQVVSKTDNNNFVIAAGVAATSPAGPTSINSGNAGFVYQIGIGPDSGPAGWGYGRFGLGGWGAGSAISQQTGSAITASDWTLANWGEDLIACPQGGGIYYWPPEMGAITALPIPNAPPYNNGIMIAMPQLILVAWGSTSSLPLGQAQDPLLVKWCDAGNFTTWAASNSNLAGDFRLSRGSQIVGGFQSTFRTLLWTDVECWSMDYIGYPYTFSFNVLGTNCGLAGRGAVAQLGSTVMWMSRSNFFTLSGAGVRVLPCPVYDAVFQDLDIANLSKIRIGANPAFNEFIVFYPSLSGGTGENDKYVKFNPVENAWDYGVMPRTAWLQESILGSPIATGTDNILYQHENGYNANASPLTPSATSGWFALSEGEDFSFVDQFYPDMRWSTWNGSQDASVNFTFQSTNYVGDTPTTYGPYTVTQATEYVPLRIRGRFLNVGISSNDSSTFWRMGRPRFRIAPAGRR